ncbi:DNA-binding beta-propeller fold protein YncE [Mucilaginibacter yixingensis]|uniref:DNA-binding beta-propeller fold protein YncE n=1 Tax=Mucilaginibacter yixingensis TaxID=1295612 RepID=A0A2T5JAG7_9SPHI|nr:YncE family protein [Mucilaginibacter yixingensis]PTQ97855.1 DNA-binding beta-propeller fold protein YncE [Mucilaginibacter yixingensis]
MKKIFCSFLSLAFCGAISSTAFAQGSQYTLVKTIPLQGDGGNDYAYVDQANHRLYASHGQAVNVVDLESGKEVGVIADMKGTHGIAIANDLNRGFISDGKGNAVIAFDIKTLKVIKTIPVSGEGPDAIIYDPASKKIFTFEGHSSSIAVVDPQSLTQVGSIAPGGAPEFAVADGKGLIYNNLEDKSRLAVIDTKTLKLVKTLPLDPCGGPTGLALDKANGRLFTVCRENKGMSVIDVATGKIVQTLPIGAGVDAVVYDAVNKLVIASNGDGTASVYKQNNADSYTLMQTLTTQPRAKTMALDADTHQIYFPVSDYQKGTKTQVAGTFKLLVYQLKNN